MAMQLRKPETRGLQAASSSSQTLGRNSVNFGRNWNASGTLSNGTEVLAEYKIHEPSGGRAYFHMLLDASGSMFVQCVDGGRHKYVYEHLFKCFEELVQSGDALRPDDMICVWSFNKKTKLLCEVETKNFHKKKDFIRKEYEKELGSETGRGETRLYDAVATVMDQKIRKTWETNKKADFFLVAFTDGRDSRTGSTSLDTMMQKIMELVGRLHTFFITVNLPTKSSLYKRLDGQKEMSLIQCESTQPSEISRAFNTLRELIKAVLVFVMKEAGVDGLPPVTRIVEYGKTKEAIGDRMMATLASGMRSSSLLEAYGNLKLNYN